MTTFPAAFPPWVIVLAFGVSAVTIGVGATLVWSDITKLAALLRIKSAWIGPTVLVIGLTLIVGVLVWHVANAPPGAFTDSGGPVVMIFAASVLIGSFLVFSRPASRSDEAGISADGKSTAITSADLDPTKQIPHIPENLAGLPSVVATMRRDADARAQYVDREIHRTDLTIDELLRRIGALDQQINQPDSMFSIGGNKFELIEKRLTSIEGATEALNEKDELLKDLKAKVAFILAYNAKDTNIRHFSDQIKSAPCKLEEIGKPGDINNTERENMDKFVNRIIRITRDTPWNEGIDFAISNAIALAEIKAREASQQNTMLDVLSFRVNLIAQMKYSAVLSILHHHRDELEQELLQLGGPLRVRPS